MGSFSCQLSLSAFVDFDTLGFPTVKEIFKKKKMQQDRGDIIREGKGAEVVTMGHGKPTSIHKVSRGVFSFPGFLSLDGAPRLPCLAALVHLC